MKHLTKVIVFIVLSIQISCTSAIELPPSVQTYTSSAAEIDMLIIINSYRLQNNLNLVIEAEHISAIAHEHNIWMIENTMVSHHYFSNRSKNIQKVLNVTQVSEILAFNYTANPGAFNAWVNSPRHKHVLDNSRFTYVGISITASTITNRQHFTVIFAGN